MYRYNSPPNWPTPPDRWVPPEDWLPDAAWGPAPVGWDFWTWEDGEPATVAPPAPAAGEVLPAAGIALPARPHASAPQHKRRRGWIVPVSVAAVALLVGIAIGRASKNSSPTSPASVAATTSTALSRDQNVGASGATFTLTNGQELKATVVAMLATHLVGDGPLAQKPAKGVYEVANIHVAVQAGTLEYNTLDFKFLASDGNAYTHVDGNAATAGFDPSYGSGTLTAGQARGGNVVFDVPPGGGTLQMTGGGLFGDGIVAQWKVH